MTPCLDFHYLLEQLQNSWKYWSSPGYYIIKDRIKIQMNSQKKRYTGQGPEGSQEQEFLFPWGSSPPPGLLACRCVHQHRGSPSPIYWDSCGGFLTQACSSIYSISNPSSLSGESGVGLKAAWSFWWPTPSRSPPRLTSLKQKLPLPDFIQEIPRNIGTLYHEPGLKANICISYCLSLASPLCPSMQNNFHKYWDILASLNDGHIRGVNNPGDLGLDD